MNIFKRIGDIVSSNVNSALDRMEDPEKMIDLSIRELEDSISEMKSLKAEKSAEMNTLRDKISEEKNQVSRWQERAELALKKNLDDMAKEALVEKKSIEKMIALDKEQLSDLDTIFDQLDVSLTLAMEKLTELKETSSTLKTRAKVAKERMDANRKSNVSETADWNRRLEELKLKVERWEAEADIHQNTVRSEEKKPFPTFEDLERDEEIEKELSRLKESMNKENGEN